MKISVQHLSSLRAIEFTCKEKYGTTRASNVLENIDNNWKATVSNCYILAKPKHLLNFVRLVILLQCI